MVEGRLALPRADVVSMAVSLLRFSIFQNKDLKTIFVIREGVRKSVQIRKLFQYDLQPPISQNAVLHIASLALGRNGAIY